MLWASLQVKPKSSEWAIEYRKVERCWRIKWAIMVAAFFANHFRQIGTPESLEMPCRHGIVLTPKH